MEIRTRTRTSSFNGKPMTPRGKLMFALGFTLLGLIAMLFGLQGIYKAHASKSWPSTTGQVTVSKLEKRYKDGHMQEQERQFSSERRRREIDRNTTFMAKIHYSYSVNSQDYEGQRVSFGGVSTNNPKDAQRVLKRYPRGKEVKVYYHPQNPKDSLLEPGITGSAFFLPGLGGLFMGVGLFIGLLGFFKKS